MKEAIDRLKKQKRHIREVADSLEVVKATIVHIPKKTKQMQ